MLTIVIAILAGVAAGWASVSDLGVWWGIFNGFVVFVIVQLLIGLLIKRKANKINIKIQTIMTEAQNKINRKVQVFQRKPGGNIKAIQKTLEKDQADSILESLEASKEMEPLFKWNFLLKKQINTMRMMFYYQIKDFEKVDRLMDDAMMFDARAVAMKIARMYKKQDPELHKFFAKKIKRIKGEDSVLLYGLYSWILVKEEQIDKALEILVQAKKKTDDPTIQENWEKLANGRVKQFSNAGLGELWYSLYLEEPKIKQQRVQHRGF